MKIIILLLTCLTPFLVPAQEDQPFLDRLSAKLENYRQAFPGEKVCLQTDKEIYEPGEIIWFNAKVADLSDLQSPGTSGEIFVHLYNATGDLITEDKYLLNEGTTPGDILLPESLPLGRYYLSAYSPLQPVPEQVFIKPLLIDRYYEGDVVVSLLFPGRVYRAGEKAPVELEVTDFNGKPADRYLLNYEIFHGNKKLKGDKIRSSMGKAMIPLIIPEKTGREPLVLTLSHPKNLWTKRIPLRTTADSIQVSFSPEGGNLVEGMQQKTGFYATACDGIPIPVEADILDAKGLLVTKTKTFCPGYGIFSHTANKGDIYRLVITSEYGKGKAFELPEPVPSGLTLTVSGKDDQYIRANLLNGSKNPRPLAITATKGLSLKWAANFEISSSSRINIPVAGFGRGIIRLTVFNTSGEILSSRLVYLPGNNTSNMDISSDLSEKEKVKITVKTSDEEGQSLPSELTFSVYDLRRQTGLGLSMDDYFNLESEIQHGLPAVPDKPGEEYLSSNLLDNILICNDLKSFSWDKVVNFTGELRKEALLNSKSLSGRVTDRKGEPVPNAKVSMVNGQDMQLISAVADEKGHFVIYTQKPVDRTHLTITASDEKGKGNFRVETDPAFSDRVGWVVRSADLRFGAVDLPRQGLAEYLTSNPDLLSQQPVAKPIVAAEKKHEKGETFKALLQSGTSLTEVIKMMKPYSVVNNQIVFYGTLNSIMAQSGALIVIDGQKLGTDMNALNQISPHDVDNIRISLDPSDIQLYTGLNNVGIIEITTKRGEYIPPPQNMGEEELLYKDGYRIPRNFLSTDAMKGKSGKDLRTTLYWNPALITGETGSITFTVPLSSVRSGFVISAEGISPSGQVFRKEHTFHTGN